MANMTRVNALLDSIEHDITKWDQGSWAKIKYNKPRPDNNWCGAVFCMAGHGAIAAGWNPIISYQDYDNGEHYEWANPDEFVPELTVLNREEDDYWVKYDAAMSNARVPSEIAREWLEITELEASHLFVGYGVYWDQEQFPQYRQYAMAILSGEYDLDDSYVVNALYMHFKRANSDTVELYPLPNKINEVPA